MLGPYFILDWRESKRASELTDSELQSELDSMAQNDALTLLLRNYALHLEQRMRRDRAQEVVQNGQWRRWWRRWLDEPVKAVSLLFLLDVVAAVSIYLCFHYPWPFGK